MSANPVRPNRFHDQPLPAIPDIGKMTADQGSVTLSQHRTHLSTFRTGLSEHRTDLSEYRTDLSGERTEMSMRRTGLSFQRTRMSADRTLMSVIRTSLSLIGFGFTIYQFFEKLKDAGTLARAAAPRNFGTTLVLLGIAMLVLGIGYHVQFMFGLRHEREAMRAEGLIHAQSLFPPSMTLITAIILLLIGVGAILSMMFNVGPFE
jgi:uncharacterized membrane protein YidH (DUF202 family)